MFNFEFLHEDAQFKLLYGSEGSFWASADPLNASVVTANLADGIWLALSSDGTWVVADEVVNAYPILEMKYQYDNQAVSGVTVAMGAGWYAVTKRFTYTGAEGEPAAPAIGHKLRVVNGVLQPVETDGSQDDIAVARIEYVVNSTTLLIQKI